MRWLNASVEFICSMTSSSKSLALNPFQSSQESEPLPVRILRRNRHRRAATDELHSDPYSFYYNYACFLQYYMYMMSLAHFNTQTTTTTAPPAQTTTAKPLGDDQQVYFPQFFPYYYLAGHKPVYFPPSSDCDSSSSTGQSPQCSQDPQEKWPPSGHSHLGNPLLLKQILQQYYGRDPDQAHHQPTSSGKPHDPTPQNTSPTFRTRSSTTPATVTRTPCPNHERPIGASCLEASMYIPYENLTFPPHISYETLKPVEDQQNIPERSYNLHVGLQPRAHPYQWAGALPEHYHKWPVDWWYWYYHQFANIPVDSGASNWPWAKMEAISICCTFETTELNNVYNKTLETHCVFINSVVTWQFKFLMSSQM